MYRYTHCCISISFKQRFLLLNIEYINLEIFIHIYLRMYTYMNMCVHIFVGSSGGSGLSKKQMKQDSKEKEFTEFNPDKKLRKQGKIGASSFKSKSKFKRRK